MSEHEEDFAAMFEASLKAKRFERGQTIEGTIVAIGPEVALVSVGGKSEAQIDVAELKDEAGALEFRTGDRVDATVVSTAGGLVLSRRMLRGAASERQVRAAFESGLAVEGKVERVVKGGYEVRVAGQRAFCPFSQIDIVRTADPAAHEGHVYTFRIIEFKEGGRNLVVSRRALLEETQRARADEVRQSITEGAVVSGRVVSVRDFGAFVDLGGGVQGLLHVSEMAWSRVTDPSQIAAPGDEITVKVLRIENDGQKIALGLKQLADDPWSKVAVAYRPGQIHRGRVVRVASFGAFIELEPGIQGLMPASESGIAREAELTRAFPVGTDLEVVILEIDEAARRIRLSRKAVFDAQEAAEVREYQSRAEVAPSPGVGALAEKLRGAFERRDR